MDLETFFDKPGIGGIVAGVVIVSLIICYGLTLKWILNGHEKKTDHS